jgi:DNA-binding XRE family transcriptional regulator
MHSKARKKHVIGQLRREIGATQANLARRLGISLSSLQKIESGKLALPRKVAYGMAGQTTINHRWFLRNELPPSRNIERIRERYRLIELTGNLDAKPGNHFYHSQYLRPRMILLRYFVLFLEIAERLEHGGCVVTGFYRHLGRLAETLLRNCITDRQRQKEVYEKAKARGEAAILAYLQKTITELRHAIRDKEK